MPFCQKCGKEIKEGYNFCDVCGTKREEGIKAQPKEVVGEGSKYKRLFLYGGIACLIIIAFFVICIILFPYEATEAYDAQEPYEAQEPYQDIEYYTETVPTTEQGAKALTYRIESEGSKNCGDLFNYQECVDYLVYNTDTEAGTFTLNCKAKITSSSDLPSVGKVFTDTASANIIASGVARLECGAFDINLGDAMSYEGTTVTPPTKTVTTSGTKQVQKSRTVTKYRTTTHYRTVQKERKVWKKDTLFNMWTGKTQWWYKV